MDPKLKNSIVETPSFELVKKGIKNAIDTKDNPIRETKVREIKNAK
jgi:hypothetical protein